MMYLLLSLRWLKRRYQVEITDKIEIEIPDEYTRESIKLQMSWRQALGKFLGGFIFSWKVARLYGNADIPLTNIPVQYI